MSMNVYINAKREVTITATGEKDFQWKKFDAWQTPTSVSYGIVNSDDPIQSYIDWVRGFGKDLVREIPVYAPDDYFSENPPIGSETYDPASEHIEDLNEWVSHVRSQHYEVFLEVM